MFWPGSRYGTRIGSRQQECKREQWVAIFMNIGLLWGRVVSGLKQRSSVFCDGGRGTTKVNIVVGGKVGAWGRQRKGGGGRTV